MDEQEERQLEHAMEELQKRGQEDRGINRTPCGAYLKKLREERKLGVRELARRAGISDGNLSRIENGTRIPQPNTLRALAIGLDVPLSDLFAMADYVVPSELPSMVPYLHARYGHLPEAVFAEVTEYFIQLAEDHELELDGPIAQEDEAIEREEY
jgi:transcriptional regulator with XRE-family HTH domain